MEIGIVILVLFIHLLSSDIHKDCIAIKTVKLEGNDYAEDGTPMKYSKTVILKRYYR